MARHIHPLRQFRFEAGWRQTDLERESQITQTAISKIETFYVKHPSAYVLRALSRALNRRFRRLRQPQISFEDLMPPTDPPPFKRTKHRVRWIRRRKLKAPTVN
jgi:transcriptional regulator with XRE-family HTH domain